MIQRAGGLTPQHFVQKWSRVELSERSASQQHFIDLCRLLGQPAPADHDATGAEYAFEKGIDVTAGASAGAKGDFGFADVWWKGKFAWEYKRKGKYKDLDDAYRQLLQYREALGNPPLLIVSDIARIEIHTNFTGTTKQVHTIALAELTEPAALDKLRRVFIDPESFKPQITVEKVTQDVAAEIGKLALALQKRGHQPLDVAHFLMKCVFCLFAEDINLLPNKLFKKLLDRAHHEPEKFKSLATQLFAAMKSGGEFGLDPIPFFNGGLFDDADALDLNYSDIGLLLVASGKDWSAVEPHIFGTLFERALDPSKRAQIGAHYTGRDDIMLVVEPVVMTPLRREWDATKAKIAEQMVKRTVAVKGVGLRNLSGKEKAEVTRINNAIHKLLGDFQGRLAHVRVLDPACGSGNFLYIALQQLLNLEKEVIAFGALPHIAMPLLPRVRPTQLHGIEINTYAAELASVVIWIGYLQWMRDNGFVAPSNPVLEKMQTIENRDAILDLSNPKLPVPAKWPEADFIIGNPPFLGSKLFRKFGITEDYLNALWKAHDLPRPSDLCCYWFGIAQQRISEKPATRVGLLATQGIRGGDNRTVLERIKSTGDIFVAWSDHEWVLDGAMVHVSIVGFSGKADSHVLDGRSVPGINANLTSGLDATTAKHLDENQAVDWSIGTQKGGAFDLGFSTARELLARPSVSSEPILTVVRPWISGIDVTARNRGKWVIYFDPEMEMDAAATFDAPFQHAQAQVKPFRETVRREAYRKRWWIHQEAREGLDTKLKAAGRFVLTATVTKFRIFAWANAPTMPDKQTTIFIRSDDYFFGVVHSALHEIWAREQGTQLREAESGFRYTPSSCFDTFPLPWPPGKEAIRHPAYGRIAAAAKALNEQRERWLNPPEWIEPLAAKIDAADDFSDVPAEARALVRQSAIMAAAAKDPKLKKRTLTNLYNERPTWLRIAHQELDRSVLSAYAAVDPEGGWNEDWAEVWFDKGAGQPLKPDHPLAAKRAEVEQRLLANLLRLNHARAGGGD